MKWNPAPSKCEIMNWLTYQENLEHLISNFAWAEAVLSMVTHECQRELSKKVRGISKIVRGIPKILRWIFKNVKGISKKSKSGISRIPENLDYIILINSYCLSNGLQFVIIITGWLKFGIIPKQSIRSKVSKVGLAFPVHSFYLHTSF